MLDKKKVSKNFAASSMSYEQEARVQRCCVQQLLTLAGENELFKDRQRILEVGCGTGLLTNSYAHLCGSKKLYLNDLAPELVEHTAARICCACELLVGDMEQLPIPRELDLVLSSSALQWFVDLPRFCQRLADSLSVGGAVLFSLCSEGTMGELSACTGQGLNYWSLSRLSEIFSQHFMVEHLEEQCDQLYFNSFAEIIRHIKATGVGAVPGKTMGVAELRRVGREYENRYRTARGLPVTYHNIFILAHKRGR